MAKIKAAVINGEPVLMLSDKILQWRINKLVKQIGKILKVDAGQIKTCLTIRIGDNNGFNIQSKIN